MWWGKESSDECKNRLSARKKAAVAYTGLFAVGSFLSIKRDYPAEALGMKTGWFTKKGVLSWIHGGGLAAPWSMILQLWIAVGMAGAPGRKGRRGKAWLAFLASMFHRRLCCRAGQSQDRHA